MDVTSSGWVPRLSVSAQDVPEPVCSIATLRKMRQLIGADAVNWAVRQAADAAKQFFADSGDSHSAAQSAYVQRLGIESGYLSILETLDRGHPVAPYLTLDGMKYMREVIEQRVPLGAVLEQIRRGHAYISAQLMDACEKLVPPGKLPEQLRFISQTLFDHVEILMNEVGPAFENAERTWHESLYASRAVTLEQVLRGEITDQIEASRRLGYEINHRCHIGLVIHQNDAMPPGRDLGNLASQALEVLEVGETLLIPRGHATLWAWGSSVTQIDSRRISGWEGAHVAVGSAQWGYDGFRHTHAQALETHHIASMRSNQPVRAALFDEMKLLRILLADPGRAAEFVESELHALANEEPKMSDLRRTLHAFFETSNLRETATRLHIARNTVTYRLNRAADVIGHDLHERQLETWIALELRDYTRHAPPESVGLKRSEAEPAARALPSAVKVRPC